MLTPSAAPLRHTAPPRLALPKCLPVIVLLAVLLTAIGRPAFAATTITYTGQLLSGTTPLSGQYDFKFTLYNALTGGSTVGTVVSKSSLTVADGLFTAELDFGSVYSGSALYLQTQYRKTGSTTYTTLSPRKLLSNSAFAEYADVSGSTKALQGKALSATAPATGQVLTWDGSLWSPKTAAAAKTYTAGTGLSLSGTQFTVKAGGITNSLLADGSVSGSKLSLPLSASASSSNTLLSVTNSSDSGDAISGIASNIGVHGQGTYGLYGEGSAYGVYGHGVNWGVYGIGGAYGVYGSGSYYGTYGEGSAVGAYGYGANYGVYANSHNVGVWGEGSGNVGVWGKGPYGVVGEGTTYGGYFYGNVYVSGTLSKAGGSFKIDHPLDPAHKYLSHSFVESPDMMNIYNGMITTDSHGEATVTMPDWFEALNRDFRYQLTCVGQFAQAIVATEMDGSQFTIRTDKPSVKVSWQVTGIRHDAWANAHRIPVEEDKPDEEQGTFLHPKELGQPQSTGIDFRRVQAAVRPPAKQLPAPPAQ